MKKYLLLSGFLLFAWQSNAQITFENGSWADIQAKAKSSGKMIFVDAYTTWCGPCKWLSANVFTDQSVGTYHNAQFVNYKLDMEKGEGPEFAERFGVQAYPTLLYFSKEGELVHRIVGAMPAEMLLEKSKGASTPDGQYYTQLKKYEAGQRSQAFLRQLIQAAESAGAEETGQFVAELLKSLPKSEWEKPENLKYVGMSAPSLDSEEFRLIEKNRDKLGQDDFQQILLGLLDKEMNEVIRLKSVSRMEAMKAKISQYLPEQAAQINPQIDAYYAKATGDNSATEKVLAESKDWSQLNEAAWGVYEDEASTNEQLQKALGWAKRSIELEENFYNTDTFAHLSYKLGNKSEALKWAKKALEIGKKSGQDVSGTEALIKQIKGK